MLTHIPACKNADRYEQPGIWLRLLDERRFPDTVHHESPQEDRTG